MTYFEFYMTLAGFAIGLGLLAWLMYVRVIHKIAQERADLQALVAKQPRVVLDKVDFMHPEDLTPREWIVTGKHADRQRIDQGGLSTIQAKAFAVSLKESGFYDITFNQV